MKNLQQLLYGSVFLALVGIAITFTACEKTNFTTKENNINARSSINKLNWLELSNEKTSTKLELKNENNYKFSGLFYGYQVRNLSFFSELNKDIESLITEKSNTNEVLYILNNREENQIEIGEFTKVSESHFSFSIKSAKNTKSIFSIKHNGQLKFNDFVDFLPNYNKLIANNGGIENIETIECGLPALLIGAAIIIIKIGLDHCQEIINAGILGCSASGKCYTVGYCSVECFTCDDN